MLGPHGDALLRALGREPAAQGIIEPAQMAAALEAIRRAIDTEEQERAEAERAAAAEGAKLAPRRGPGLRQRWWPMAEMLKRAQAAGQPIVWGV
jgi:hypothetical protein